MDADVEREAEWWDREGGGPKERNKTEAGNRSKRCGSRDRWNRNWRKSSRSGGSLGRRGDKTRAICSR